MKVGKKSVVGPFVSLATRLPCLREELSRNPQARVKLEELYETARDPDAVVAKLGLSEHPEALITAIICNSSNK